MTTGSSVSLSQTQLGMWFEQRANPQSSALNVGFAVEIEGAATEDIERAFQVALQRVVKGEPHLREGNGVPFLETGADIPVDVLDSAPGNINATASEFLSHPFDLDSESLVRASLAPTGPQKSLVMVAAHHIVCDFQSLATLFNAILDAASGKLRLAADSHGGASPSGIEKQFRASAVYSKAHGHLMQTLADMPSRIRLPADAGLCTEQGSHKIGFEFPPALRDAILAASSRSESSVSQLLNCLVQIHLHAMSGQERLLLGVPVAMRGRDDHGFGCYINTVPVPARISADDTFDTRLAASCRSVRGALRYRGYAWPSIVQDLRRQKLGEPSLDVLFNFYDLSLFANPAIAEIYFGSRREVSTGDHRVRPVQVQVGEAGARLSYTFGHTGKRIYGEIQAAASLLDEAGLDAMRVQFERFALALLTGPRERILDVLTGTMNEIRPANVWGHLRRARASSYILEGDKKVSLRSLSRSANPLSRAFADRGLRRGMPVVVDLPPSREWLLSILALWRVGAVYVPVWHRLCDAEKLERAHAMGARYVISREACWNTGEFEVLTPSAGKVVRKGTRGRWHPAPAVRLAYLLATSGSTGAPKVVGVSHEGLLAFARAARSAYGITMRDRILAFHRPDRDGSLEELILALRTGADLVLNPDVDVYSVTELLGYVKRMRVSVLDLPTAYFHEMLLGMAEAELSLPRTIRKVIVGGEALTETDLERWWAIARKQTRLVNSYGLTETTIVNTAWQPQWRTRSSVGIGVALDNSQLYLFDEDGRQSAPSAGQSGELFLGGPCVASYLGDNITFERIRLSPVASAGLLYRSYDFVRCADNGALQFLHRLDGKVKMAGALVSGDVKSQPLTRHSAGYREPTDLLGRRLARIYAEVVGHDKIGEDDSFFEVGGSSLLAVRVLARIRGEFGTSIPYAQFLQTSSVSGVARLLSASQVKYEPVRQAKHLLEPLWGAAERDPEKIAVVSGDTEISFRQLRRLLAGAAINLGHLKQDLVPVKATSRVEEVLVCMGIACSGRAYVSVDRKSPDERIRAFLVRAQLDFAISDSEFAGIQRVTPADLLEGAGPRRPGFEPATLAYACMTSGSSGIPKAVVMQHERALNTLRDVLVRFQVDAGDVVLALSPMSFDLSVFDVFGVLGMGGRLIVPGGDAPEDWLCALKRHQVTLWNSTPGHMQMFLDLYEDEARDALGSLRLAMFSGDFLPPSLVERIRKILPDLRIVALGGATEAGIWSNFHEVGSERYACIPYGRPLDGQGMEVIDKAGEICAPGELGEIVITGASLADGYYGERELTEKVFRPHPRRNERAFFTGDEGYYMENGEIAIVGRIDQELKIRGYRVHPAEIESTLRADGYLHDASVQVSRTNDLNELTLFAVLADGITLDALYSHIRSRFPEYMQPKGVTVVPDIPRTATGKVDAGALTFLGGEECPVPEREPESHGDELVARIRSIFRERIGVDTVGESDDFFALGGNSLTAAATIAAIHAQTGIRVPLPVFSKIPTPAAIAQVIRADAEAEHGAHRSIEELERIAREHIVSTKYPLPRRKVIRNTLITGATGSLGAAILANLGRETRTRFIVLGRKTPARLPRNVRWLRGDLEKERFGLTNAEYRDLTKVDSIIHLAAQVNFAASLNALLPANVEGTRRILDLAATGEGKTLHYFSTAGIFPYGTSETCFEDDSEPRTGSLLGGYAQSKWIAEDIVRHARDAGLRTVIYRPGFVANEFAMQDLAGMVMKAVLRLRAIPDIPFSLDVVSRDYAAACFRAIWKESAAVGRTFHINNPNPIALDDMERYLHSHNIPVRRLPFEEWLQGVTRMIDSAPDLAGLELLRGLRAKDLEMPVLDCRNTLQFVRNSQLHSLNRSVRAWMSGLVDTEAKL